MAQFFKCFALCTLVRATQAESQDLPHLLVYGPSGAGKKTRIAALLRAIYGPSVDKVRCYVCVRWRRRRAHVPTKRGYALRMWSAACRVPAFVQRLRRCSAGGAARATQHSRARSSVQMKVEHKGVKVRRRWRWWRATCAPTTVFLFCFFFSSFFRFLRAQIANRSDKLEIVCLVSNYHIELTPSDAAHQDRLIVQEVIKEIAQSRPLDAAAHPFKVVVMHDVDHLSAGAQHALRRTMERYMATCRLVLCCNSTGKVIDALHSRCLALRVAAPAASDVAAVLCDVASKEGVPLPLPLAERVSAASARNLRDALLMLECLKVRHGTLTAELTPELPDWTLYVHAIASGILQEQSPQKLLSVRDQLYELLGHCVPAPLLLRMLCERLLDKVDHSLGQHVVRWAAHYEQRLHEGNKDIIHLEAFIARFMALYKKYLLDSFA